MRSTIAIFAILFVGIASAQWACQLNSGWGSSIPNCASCNSAFSGSSFWVCTSCTTGFFLNQTWCQPCTANCKTCQSNGACSSGSCLPGFYYNALNGTCLACPTGCKSCDYTTSSYEMATATISTSSNNFIPIAVVTAAGQQIVPATGQQVSQTTTNTFYGSGIYTCTACYTGSYLTLTGTCTTCPTNSVSCSAGTGVSLGSNILTVVCPSSSVGTTSAGYTNVQGYVATYAAGVASCTMCPTSCTYCTTSTTCATCAPGYLLSGGNTCTICKDAGCNVCTSSTTASTCSSTGTSACATGFVSSILPGSSVATCTTACTATNCLYCTSSNGGVLSTSTCSLCAVGYVLISGACVVCPVGCLNGTVSWTNPAYPYFNVTSSCVASSTLSTTVALCSACAQNYTLVQTDLTYTTSTSQQQTISPGASGICVPLPLNCLNGIATAATATATSVATCTQCYPGYGLIWNPATGAQTCQSCNMTNCLTCDFSGVCTSCNVTTYLAPHQCFQCPYNCSACANATYCFNNCTKNYVYNAATGQCLPNGAERIILAGFALISVFLYFL